MPLLNQLVEEAYHLEPLLHGGSTLEVGGSGLDVVVDGLLRQINHVRGVEGLAVLLEVGLIGVQKAIEPREELLGAVVGVKDDRDAVGGGNAADVVSSGNTTGDGSGLAVIADALRRLVRFCFVLEVITYLASEESSTTLGDLEDDGAVLVASSLEGRDDSGRGGDVLRRVLESTIPAMRCN